MDTDLLEKLLESKEGQFLEFKSCYEGPKGRIKRRKAKDVARDIAETLSAMANADGGTLLVGVEDDGIVSGVDYPSDKLKLLLEVPSTLIRPVLRPNIERLFYESKLTLMFEIGYSLDTHQLTDGRYLLRVGDKNQPFPAEQISALKQAKTGTLYERQFIPIASFEDLDWQLLEKFKEGVKDPRSPQELLHDEYRLLDFRDAKPYLTMAALLLFAKDPLKWHPRCGVDFVKFEGTERKYGADLNIVKRIRIEEPLLELVPNAYATIKEHVKERVVLHDLFFRERFEYPEFAWQEALVNAVAHRDYSLTGSSIEVWMFDDHMEIRSPGRLPDPITLDQLLRRERVHFSRNPLIVRVLTDLGYMRELGEGIPRMFDEMEKNFLQPPEFKEEAFMFSVTLKNTPIFDLETQRWLLRFSDYGLNLRQMRVLAYARQYGGGSFTNRMYQKIAEVDRDWAYREIREMVQAGIVIRPRGKYRYLVLEPAEAIPLLEETVQIGKIVLAKGFVTNSDVRNALGFTRHIAQKILRQLVDDGLLELYGKGRGANYKPTVSLRRILRGVKMR